MQQIFPRIQKIYFDLEDFQLKKIDFDEITNSFGYFHKEIELKIEKNYLYNLETSLNDCIFSCHPEMFLYFQYKIIILREFKTHLNQINENKLFEKFREIVSVILMETFRIKTESYDKLSSEEINEIRLKYSNEIDYAHGFNLPIVHFVTNNEEAKRISCEVLGDIFRIHSQYIQKVFIKALEIVERRIKLNSKNKSFFSHEIVIGSKDVQLKIFPTLYAFTRLEEVGNIWNSGNLLINYLKTNNFSQIENSELNLKSETKYIFEHPEILQPFYNDLSNSLSFTQFGRQKRNKMGECIFNQGQINFSLKN